MTVLGKLGVELYADHYGLTRGMQQAQHAIESFERKTLSASKALEQYESAAAKAGKALQHAFKAGDISSGSRKITKDALKGFEDIKDEAKDAGKAVGESFLKTAAAISVVSFAAKQVLSAIQAVYHAAEEGARNSAAEAFFRNAGKSIEEYREATKGLISDAALMKKANLADSMGISENAFKQLSQVAHAASLKTGQSFEYMFDSIIVGTARSSRLLLDNLGIIVSVEQANKNYARSLKEADTSGKYANMTIEQMSDKLSDKAKKLAFVEEVMKQSKKQLDEYSKVGDLAADRFDKFNAAIENLANAVKKNLGDAISTILPELTKMVNFLTAAVNGLRDLGAMDIASAFGKGIAAQGAAAGNPLVGAGVFLNELAGSSVAKPMAERDDRINALVTDLQLFYDETITLEEVLSKTPEEIEDLAHVLKSDLSGSIASVMVAIRKIAADANGFYGAVNSGGKKLDGDRPGLDESADDGKDGKKKRRIDGNPDPHMEFAEWARKAQAKADEYHEKFTKEDIDRDEKLEEFRRAARAKLIEDEIKARAEEEEIRKKKLAALDNNVASGLNLAGAAVQGDAAGFFTQLGTVIGTAMGVPAIGTAIGSILGPLLEPLTVVGDLFDHIVKGAGSLIELGLKPLLDTLLPLGPALEILLAAVGHLVGSALAPFLPLVGLIVNGLSAMVAVVAAVVTVLSPIVEAFVALFSVVLPLGQVIFSIVSAFMGSSMSFHDMMQAAVYSIELFVRKTAQAAVNMNNGIVDFIRKLGHHLEAMIGQDFGFSDFGQRLTLEDLLEANEASLEENTSATQDNTRATRDLIREFRNLPQGYKINYAIYEAQGPAARPGDYFAGSRDPRGGGNSMVGWRDWYRGRT